MKLTNTFHNTTVNTRLTRDEMNRIEMDKARGKATPNELARMRWIRNCLCGRRGCTCGNAWGERK